MTAGQNMKLVVFLLGRRKVLNSLYFHPAVLQRAYVITIKCRQWWVGLGPVPTFRQADMPLPVLGLLYTKDSVPCACDA